MNTEYEYLYPTTAQSMLGHIDDVIHTHGSDLSEDNIDRMADDLARRSSMGGDPPRGHNRSTLNDLARLLLLQRLIDQGGAVPFFPYAPFYVVPPFFPSPRPHVRPPVRPVHPIQPIRPHGRR